MKSLAVLVEARSLLKASSSGAKGIRVERALMNTCEEREPA